MDSLAGSVGVSRARAVELLGRLEELDLARADRDSFVLTGKGGTTPSTSSGPTAFWSGTWPTGPGSFRRTGTGRPSGESTAVARRPGVPGRQSGPSSL